MWIGMYLLFILLIAVLTWAIATQILIPVATGRPILPILTVGRAQHQVAAAREHKLISTLQGQRDLLESESKALSSSVLEQCDVLRGLLKKPSPSVEWRDECVATIQRIEESIGAFDTHN
jgi:hypothetical protein